MSYVYTEQKQGLLTDEGQRLFLKVRDKAKQLLKDAGAFRLQECISGFSGDSWQMIACLDRMVEIGEIIEVTPHSKVHHWAQNRIFTDGGYRP